ncbi:unnamed protein product, partial [Prorocentrum cordatum]
MSFSEVHRETLGHFSPDGGHLAGVSNNRILVRDARTLRLAEVFVCAAKVERIEWSADSEFLLAEVARPGLVQIWSLRDSSWACRIEEGIAGVARARWGPASRHVFVVADFGLYLAAWALEDGRRAAQIRYPKYPHRGLAFGREGRCLALLCRSDCRDSVAVHGCDGEFSRLAEFPLRHDCADLAWAPNDAAIILWERPAHSPHFLWYSPAGELLSQLGDCGPLRCACPAPSARLLAAGCLDGGLQLVSGDAMQPLARLEHDLGTALAEAGDDEVLVLREEDPAAEGAPVGYVRLPPGGLRVPVERRPAEVPVDSDGVPRQGVGTLSWSPDERYVATRHDGMPTAVWVWDTGRLALAALLLHRAPVRAMAWGSPSQPQGGGGSARLAVSTADSVLHFWWRGGSARLPCPLPAARLQWRCDGAAVLLQERQGVCVCGTGGLQLRDAGQGGAGRAATPP